VLTALIYQSDSSVTSRQHYSLCQPMSSHCALPLSQQLWSVGGLFPWPALRYRTAWLPDSLRDPAISRATSVHWRRFYFQLTRVHSSLELSGRCALQVYL